MNTVNLDWEDGKDEGSSVAGELNKNVGRHWQVSDARWSGSTIGTAYIVTK